MRKNLPVTQNEYHLAPGCPIVSTTDLKGRITYVNPYFVEVSGFGEDEVMGAPHNVVRHPDMPPEAFADLWATLKSGRPWSGLVKNRRKNGDFYWVLANVSPVYENGRAVGYMSVRVKPGRAQVEQAEALYRDLRAGVATARISGGEVVPHGLRGLLARARALSVSAVLGAGFGLLGVLIGALALANGLHGWTAAAGALGLALCVWLAAWVRASIVAPLSHALGAARVLAGGDLTAQVSVEGAGEVRQLLRTLRQMSSNLVAVVGDVRASAVGTRGATSEIAAGNADLAQRTESQAARLEETASSMQELASAVATNAEHARAANQLAASATVAAEEGRGAVSRMVQTMHGIDESSRRIADITAVIDSIAFQTNMLALNAAVEAARAGEQGKGFAVVASEVRMLAQRSASAAKEIKSLIDDSLARVSHGAELAGQAGQTIEHIVERTRRVASTIDAIASANIEQSAGIAVVNQAVRDIDVMTQQNAALVEEAAAAAKAVEQDAVRTTRAVDVFKLEGEGVRR